MTNTIGVRVDPHDVDLMMTVCKDLYIKAHPEMKGFILSRRFMFKKIVEQIIGD